MMGHICCVEILRRSIAKEMKAAAAAAVGSSCYLSYNVQATFTDGMQFMLDIEYDLTDGEIIRRVFDPETLNLKTKMMKPLIRSPLKEMMQEENRRLKKTMNSKSR